MSRGGKMDMAKKVLKANTPSQSATNLLAGVAVPSETASRLTADALLDDGFPLELGVVATDREQTVGVLSADLWWLVARLTRSD